MDDFDLVDDETLDILRELLLRQEGLVCRRCGAELQEQQEIAYSLCRACVREENEANGLPDVQTPDGPLPF